jgi:lipopolysaccharide export LptBFGC system permease protein LptF
VRFNADDCTINKNGSLEFTGDVVIKDSTSSPPRTLYCNRAFLHIEGDEFAPTLTMEMRSASWQRSDGVEILSRRPLVYGLLLPGSVTSEFPTSDRLAMLKPANVKKMLDTKPKSNVLGLAQQLQEEIRDTMVEIRAEIHSRLVFGIGCIPMIFIGIGLGMIKKEGHLLSAFGTSIIPAMVLVICIISGKQLTKSDDASQIFGVMVMWTGVIFMCALSVWVYRKLLKN